MSSKASSLTGNFFDGYVLQDRDNDKSPNYYGYLKYDGAWYIIKEVLDVGGDMFRYANGVDGYPKHWADRFNLTYYYYDELFK